MYKALREFISLRVIRPVSRRWGSSRSETRGASDRTIYCGVRGYECVRLGGDWTCWLGDVLPARWICEAR